MLFYNYWWLHSLVQHFLRTKPWLVDPCCWHYPDNYHFKCSGRKFIDCMWCTVFDLIILLFDGILLAMREFMFLYHINRKWQYSKLYVPSEHLNNNTANITNSMISLCAISFSLQWFGAWCINRVEIILNCWIIYWWLHKVFDYTFELKLLMS